MENNLGYQYKGKLLSEWRKSFNLTQEEFCAMINQQTGGSLSNVVLSNWENGKNVPRPLYDFQIKRLIDQLEKSTQPQAAE